MTFDSSSLEPPPEASPAVRRWARRFASPLESFAQAQTSSGVVLLAATAAALGIANSPWAASYHAVLELPLRLQLGPLEVERSLHFLVNEVLMTIFFLVVGLELRSELHHGELSTRERAALPLAAAVGGMIVPALTYLAIATPGTRAGWGVPMATDIAFALGIFALLGRGLPPSLRVLLLALAIVDDLGSILVIAAFYSGAIDPLGLVLAAVGIFAIFAMQRIGIRRPSIYAIPGVIVWLGIYRAGIHPAVSGAIVGLATPARSWLGPTGLVAVARRTIEEVEHELTTGVIGEVPIERLVEEASRIDLARREAVAPAKRVQLALSPWVAFGIMPLFALANAGVTLGGSAVRPSRLGLAVVLGLVVGKPLGILAGAALAVRLRVASLPDGVGGRELALLGVVAGIGFTMALFIAELAFPAGDELERTKAAILLGSALATVCSVVVGRWRLRSSVPVPA